MTKLRSELHHRSLYLSVIVCTIAERQLIYDHESIEILLNKAIANIEELTLLDMEATCLALSNFAYKSESGIEREFFDKILTELPNRTFQITKSPKKFISLVYSLAVNGFHDAELIQNALRPDFLKEIYMHERYYTPDLYGLDAFARINLKDSYKGSQLHEKSHRIMTKILTAYIPSKDDEFKVTGANIMTLKIGDIVEKLHKHYHIGHTLPHFPNAGW